MPQVYIHAFEGRTLDQKRNLVREVTEAVVRTLGVAPDQVLVQIIEGPKNGMARAGILFSDREAAQSSNAT